MHVEWSRSLKAARSFALFAFIVAFSTTDLLGQVAQPAPPNPLKNAIAEPVIQRADERPQGAPAQSARASEWDEDEEEEANRAVAAPVGARAIMNLNISVAGSVFLINDVRGNDVRGDVRLKKALQDKLDLITREYPDLTDLEVQRLELAGLGDIKRFQEQVAELDAKHQNTLWNGAGRREIMMELPKLQYRMQGPHFFGNQSLLTKTLRVIVTKNKLTAQEIPGASHALDLPDNPPVPMGGFAIRQVQLADGKSVMLLEHRQIMRPEPQVRRVLPAVPLPQNAVNGLEDKYYRGLLQLIIGSLETEAPLRNNQREPLLAMLRRTSKPALEIPLYDPDMALVRLSQLPEKDYLTVLDAKQWQVLQSRFEAAKVQQGKQNPRPK